MSDIIECDFFEKLAWYLLYIVAVKQNKIKEITMTKKEMSIKLASALLKAQVDENNWKVKDLMKRKKVELESHMMLANMIKGFMTDLDFSNNNIKDKGFMTDGLTLSEVGQLTDLDFSK